MSNPIWGEVSNEIWHLFGGRQGWRYGFRTESPVWWQMLNESFNEVYLSVEIATGTELVETLTATDYASRHNALVRLCGWPETWEEQRARTDAMDAEDDALYVEAARERRGT